MSPAAIGFVAGRTFAAMIGGIGIFALWAWAWHGVPDLWMTGGLMLCCAHMLTRSANRWGK